MGIGSPDEQKNQSFKLRGPKPIVDKKTFCVIGVVHLKMAIVIIQYLEVHLVYDQLVGNSLDH